MACLRSDRPASVGYSEPRLKVKKRGAVLKPDIPMFSKLYCYEIGRNNDQYRVPVTCVFGSGTVI